MMTMCTHAGISGQHDTSFIKLLQAPGFRELFSIQFNINFEHKINRPPSENPSSNIETRKNENVGTYGQDRTKGQPGFGQQGSAW